MEKSVGLFVCFDFQAGTCYSFLMKQYHFPIVIEKDSDGYFAFCPQLQGCYSQGETYEEARKNIQDAIRLHIEDRLAEREEVPSEQFVSLSTVDITV